MKEKNQTSEYDERIAKLKLFFSREGRQYFWIFTDKELLERSIGGEPVSAEGLDSDTMDTYLHGDALRFIPKGFLENMIKPVPGFEELGPFQDIAGRYWYGPFSTEDEAKDFVLNKLRMGLGSFYPIACGLKSSDDLLEIIARYPSGSIIDATNEEARLLGVVVEKVETNEEITPKKMKKIRDGQTGGR